jgi:hypothetical protein
MTPKVYLRKACEPWFRGSGRSSGERQDGRIRHVPKWKIAG